MDNFAKLGIRALISGTVAGGIFYFLLKRKDLVDIFRFELPHYGADLALVLIGSMIGDAGGSKLVGDRIALALGY